MLWIKIKNKKNTSDYFTILTREWNTDNNIYLWHGTMSRFYQINALVHAVVLALLEIFFSLVILTSKTWSELHASPEHASLLKFS